MQLDGIGKNGWVMAATPRIMEPSTTKGPHMRVEELPHEFEVDAEVPEAVPAVAEYDETAEAGRQDGDSESDDDVLDDDGPLVPPTPRTLAEPASTRAT